MKKILFILLFLPAILQAQVTGTQLNYLSGATGVLGTGNVVLSSYPTSIMLIPADTSMFADSTFGRIYSDGFVIDTLIFTVNSVGVSSVKLVVYYGTDWTGSGTAVVTAGNTITAEGTATKVYTFNNATVAAGNFVWVKMKGTIVAKYWSVQIKGHRN